MCGRYGFSARDAREVATRQLFTALHGNQAETNRFFGVLAGTVPVPEFFAPENIERILSAAAPAHATA